MLLGPSGCGKTTALRMIAGLETVTDGTLRIGDRVVNDVEAKDRDIAMVFQSYALYPHMTVRRNIESPLMARKYAVDGADAPQAHRRRAHRAGRRGRHASSASTELLDRKPGALSGGQRQRVALARAIVGRPEAFLMDEPLSNLDAKLRAQTRVELVELHEQLATTFVYVTHDQVEAMTMADRIAVIADGRLQQVGPPQAVYDRPAEPVRRPLHRQPADEHRRGHGRRLHRHRGHRRPGRGGLDPGRRQRRPAAGRGPPVVVGVRPEHLDARRSGGLRGEVTRRRVAGPRAPPLRATSAATTSSCRQSSDEAAPAAGERVELSAKPEHVHLFDPETTERVN